MMNAESLEKEEAKIPAGNPGDKSKSKKRGPTTGHTGISHSNKPSNTQYYNLDTSDYICGGNTITNKTSK